LPKIEVRAFVRNQCNIDIQFLCLHHSFPHEYANSLWHKRPKDPHIQIKMPEQTFKIETERCDSNNFSEKITLHGAFKRKTMKIILSESMKSLMPD
jgi:hypothetical protein